MQKIHSKLNLILGNLLEEYPEQLMTAMYLKKNAKVLELGANIGRNTCVINPDYMIFVQKLFKKNGLKLVYNQAGGWGACYNNFYQVWQKVKKNKMIFVSP